MVYFDFHRPLSTGPGSVGSTVAVVALDAEVVGVPVPVGSAAILVVSEIHIRKR